MLSNSIVAKLRALSITVNLLDHKGDLDMMVDTNWKTECKRRGARSKDTVTRNTAVGLGAEIAIHQIEDFKQASPITEGAVGLTYVQRKKDVICEDKSGEVKSMNGKYPVWYISEGQCESVIRSTKLNDFFLVMAYDELKPLTYKYKPKFLIDSKKLSRYIIRNAGGSSPYKFNHTKAIENGDCIDLGA